MNNIHKSQTALANNVTSVILLGFSNLQNVKIPLFSLLVLLCSATVSGNCLIITIFLLSETLQSPMYFFIAQLSLCDILLTTDIVPTLLLTVLYGGSSVTLIGCIFQFSIFVMSEASGCLLLSVMSYDRYLAICNPLRYNSIMNHMFCVLSVTVIWLVGLAVMLLYMISTYDLCYCGPNVIDYFYCDLEPILQLSCSDTSIIHKLIFMTGVLNVFCPFIIIVMSYLYISTTIMKIQSSTGRHKAFSTCSSHLTVVSMLYGTLIIVYFFPSNGQTLTLSKVLSLIYTVLTPLLNPIIYTLRNKDFKKTFHKLKLPWYRRLRGRNLCLLASV